MTSAMRPTLRLTAGAMLLGVVAAAAGAATNASSAHTPTPLSTSGRQFWQYPLLPKSMLQKVSATGHSTDETHIALSAATTLSETHALAACENAHPRCVAHSRGNAIVSH